ncbi:MAG: alkaline phosphatase D family protein [Paludisphaera borealis]|uniref:alkaline phosphatase D family protein n=1 Tax=Paludisphaera borealis TaxID=1387353 RepID=UPI00284EF836|nr:alkaline phosphatase D family protein [Paludisphaera borealis]MDR3619506.1 alkaline phosphatase D family protein [Paludisphaera borealis]
MFDLKLIHEDVRREGSINRRHWLAWTAALSATPILGGRVEGRTMRAVAFASDPFVLGVASGDPDAAGFVAWTRLAPSPLEPGGGMPAEKVEVRWEVARDEAMKDVVKSGAAVATPQLGHSVHVEVGGLEANRWYWYRFRAGDAVSPVGRARTTPAPTSDPDSLRFAFASCQHYEQGYFTAYEHMLKDDLDLVVHLGDYIYEGSGRDKLVRKHAGPEIETLEDYRIRHAQYRTDPHLRAMHAKCPWLVTWDDHEVDNNYADATSEQKGVDPADFLERRANAYQAYYEMMPLRRRSLPRGPHMDLYRTIRFGRLAGFQVLDTRQHRTDQPNGDHRSPLNDAALNRKNTLLGDRQAGWLKARLLESPATWNVLAQQVMMGMVGFRSKEGEPTYSMDQWPGYADERMRLVKFLQDRRVLNPVVLTGDIHSNWVNDLRVDDRKTETSVVATEFVGTSISSGGDGKAETPGLDKRMADNPCIRFFNAQRGYVRCTVTPKTWRSDYQVVEEVTKPGAPVVTRASFVVEAGAPGAKSA